MSISFCMRMILDSKGFGDVIVQLPLDSLLRAFSVTSVEAGIDFSPIFTLLLQHLL